MKNTIKLLSAAFVVTLAVACSQKPAETTPVDSVSTESPEAAPAPVDSTAAADSTATAPADSAAVK